MEAIHRTKKLIQESSRVAEIKSRAADDVRKLNEATKWEVFTSEQELRIILAGVNAYNNSQMRKDKLTAQMMDRGISVPVPGELQAREATLKAALGCFEFAQLGDSWVIDEEKLETACDRFRKYIDQDYQFEKLEQMEELAEMLNKLGLREGCRQRNFQNNEFVNWSESKGIWEPNLQSLFLPQRHWQI